MKQRQKVRSLFISDIHLGCKYCRAEDLLQFLRGIEAETLYLVGDIIDGWKMQRNVHWTDTYTFIVRRITGMVKNGTRVVYVTGNHDEFLRKFSPNKFGHLELVDQAIHVTPDGRRLLVIHGDLMDQIAVKAKWLYHVGDWSYMFAMWLNREYNEVRRMLGFSYWSLSMVLKRNVKQAVAFVNSFEHFIVKHTQDANCCGVICGHVHVPVIKKVEGIDYYNCGDWVESCSALVEHFDGTMELIHPVDQTAHPCQTYPFPTVETSSTITSIGP